MTVSAIDWSGIQALRDPSLVGRHRGITSPSGLYGIRALGPSGIGPPDWSIGLDCLRASNSLSVGGYDNALIIHISICVINAFIPINWLII